MTISILRKQPAFELSSIREGQRIRFSDAPAHTIKQEFEDKTERGFWASMLTLSSCVMPFTIGLHIASGQKSLSTIFGTVALGVAATVAVTYTNYRIRKSQIHRAKLIADGKIKNHLDELAHTADSTAQYNYVMNMSERVKDVGYVRPQDIAKLVNIDACHFRDADSRLQNTVAIVKNWVEDYDTTHRMALHLNGIMSKKRALPPTSLKPRTIYPTNRFVALQNFNEMADRRIQIGFDSIKEGLSDFLNVMLADTLADDYLQPYTTGHTVMTIHSTLNIKEIIRNNRKSNMAEILPALNPRDYR